jgi:putative FmdB family regulatory protein
MPIYEYKCSACQHELEALQKFADAPLVTCPACGKDALTKLVSAAGFQLKGSGWDQTVFKGSGAKPAAKTDAAKADTARAEGSKSDAAKDGAKADGGKTPEAKPAAQVAPSTPSGTTPAGA